MNGMALLVLILSVFGFVTTFTSEELRVTLSNGSKLVGKYLRSHNGRAIKSFLSIPYAKPPIGPRRFKEAEPMEKWHGVYKATKNGPICPQPPVLVNNDEVVNEDCLYLNVYAPHTFENTEALFPVILYIHGGAFFFGSSCRTSSGPEHFLDEDIILVTASYRIGPLGFLSTEDENCPGNLGLKDQLVVLNWVHDNIKEFGGDPDRVTLLGQSSGAASVSYLMNSPLANGLFSKAIAQSGTNLATWAKPALKGVPRKTAKEFAESLKCYLSDDWSINMDCLRNVSVKAIVATIKFNPLKMNSLLECAFPPVIEPDLPGAFLTEHSQEMSTENSSKIPLIAGINFDEGLGISIYLFTNPFLFRQFDENLGNELPSLLSYDDRSGLSLSDQEKITKKVKQFYFNNNHLSLENKKNITNMFTDRFFLSSFDSYLNLRLASNETSTTYVYVLTPKPSISHASLLDPTNTFHGVCHSDDLAFLFPLRDGQFSGILPTLEDNIIRKAIIKMWVDFAGTGNPTPDSNGHLPIWEKVNGFPINYYRIGNMNFENKTMFGMESGFFEDRVNFWREISIFEST